MSVKAIPVTNQLHATILMEVSTVNVILDTMVMDSNAHVRYFEIFMIIVVVVCLFLYLEATSFH